MNSNLPLFRRALADSWSSLIGWSLGIVAAIMLYLPLFPSFGGNEEMQALLDSLPPELVNAIGYDQISTGSGYAQSTFYGLIGFVLLTIAATSWGTTAVAGDEETGSLELTLAHNVSRSQVVLERSAAVIIRLAWLGLLSAILVIALNDAAELDIEPAHAFAGAAAIVGLTLLSGTVSVAVGALTGRRLYATAAGSGIAVLAYTVNAVANQSEDLDALHKWSPYHWAYGNSPLANGVDWGGLALLYGVSAALIVIAVVALNRRDLKA
ncbi:MAG TPA: ABC transporter permease subunit [Homoserinimonas sp.]|nr:ABC transporter permease subunit [Homoserinimonas sp.]